MLHKFLWLMILFLTASALRAEFDTESLGGELAQKTQKFLGAQTAESRAMMPAFSDDELQKISQAFRKSHSTEEQRIFWLAEESYRRNAERVAAERVRYLYYAVLAAFAILAGFSVLTYRQSRRTTAPAHAHSVPEATPVYPATAEPLRKKSAPAKGKRKK